MLSDILKQISDSFFSHTPTSIPKGATNSCPKNIIIQGESRPSLDDETIHYSLILRESDSIGNYKYINGDLGLSDCKIQTLSPIISINGDIWCSYYHVKPILKTLGSLQTIEGNARFRYTPLENLGELEYVGGDLSLRDTKIKDLGKLKYIGGNLHLPKRLKNCINLDSIEIKGQVRYWNDCRDNATDNIDSDSILTKSDIPVPLWENAYIYPSHSIYQESGAVQNFYKHFKHSFDNGILLDTEGYTNYYFMLMFDIQRQISDPYILTEKFSLLCKGYPKVKIYCDDFLLDLYEKHHMHQHSWDIIKSRPNLTLETVSQYCKLLGNDIFDGTIALKLIGISCFTPFGQNHIDLILSFFKKSLYSYPKTQEHNMLDVLDYEDIRAILVNAEDLYRESIGVAKIGEGWVNETALFYKIKEHYKEYKVVHHGQPSWLGKQHLDIYFEDLNIGIEYQGIQHYKPVDYFGGEDGFLKNQERDKRKRRLCKKNSCPLIYVDEGYNFKDVIKQIDAAINSVKDAISKS